MVFKIFLVSLTLLLSYCASGPSKEEISSVQNQVSSTGADGQLIQNYRVILLPAIKVDAKLKKRTLDESPDARQFQAELRSALIQSKKALVVDRDITEKALEEIQFSMTGLVDRSTAPKLGKISGGQKFIELLTSATNVTLSYSDIETNRVEYSQTVKNSAYYEMVNNFIKFLDHNILLNNLSKLKSNSSSISVKLSPSKSKYKNNDPISFTAKVSEDAFLYLILIQNDGEIFSLYPNENQTNNLVKAGDTIVIPDKNSGVVFAAGEPFGTDRVKAIASKTKLNLFHTSKIAGSPFGQVEEKGERFTRGIKQVVTGLSASEWNSTEVEIATEP